MSTKSMEAAISQFQQSDQLLLLAYSQRPKLISRTHFKEMGNIGAYLSIVNDINDVVYCQVGNDKAAIQVFEIGSAVVAGLAAMVVTAGSAAPLFASLGANGVVRIMGISTRVAMALTRAASAAAGAAEVAETALGVLDVAVGHAIKLAKDSGYVEIMPGKTHRYGKFTLSLWQQAECKRFRKLPNEMKFVLDEVIMRPIMSGATAESNNDHKISFWVKKFGYGNTQTFELAPPEGSSSWGNVNAPLVESVNSTQPVCDVCNGNGKVIHPQVNVSIPNHGIMTCLEVEEAGKNGKIPSEWCPLVTAYLYPCGCLPPSFPSTNYRNNNALLCASVSSAGTADVPGSDASVERPSSQESDICPASFTGLWPTDACKSFVWCEKGSTYAGPQACPTSTLFDKACEYGPEKGGCCNYAEKVVCDVPMADSSRIGSTASKSEIASGTMGLFSVGFIFVGALAYFRSSRKTKRKTPKVDLADS